MSKNELVPCVREIKCDRGHVLFFFFYSPYYSAFDIDDGISLLEESLADVMLSSDDVYILWCGDLNSRTANEFPISQSQNCFYASC